MSCSIPIIASFLILQCRGPIALNSLDTPRTSGPVVNMDQRIFDQLDRLEQGARIETRTRREDYNNDSAQKSAYDGHRGHSYGHERDYQQTQNDFVDQPMILDSFGEDSPSPA